MRRIRIARVHFTVQFHDANELVAQPYAFLSHFSSRSLNVGFHSNSITHTYLSLGSRWRFSVHDVAVARGAHTISLPSLEHTRRRPVLLASVSKGGRAVADNAPCRTCKSSSDTRANHLLFSGSRISGSASLLSRGTRVWLLRALFLSFLLFSPLSLLDFSPFFLSVTEDGAAKFYETAEIQPLQMHWR